MNCLSVLISGAGIAGPTLAYWLAHHGFYPTLVEQSPAPRTQGYVIDFWGRGYDIAERMGLMPQIRRAGYAVRELRLVDALGSRIGGFDTRLFDAATGGRFTSLPRGALSEILLRSIEGRAEIQFGRSIRHLSQLTDGVLVDFDCGTSRRFDLVIGADGLHSRVRALAFGDHSKFEKFLGYTVAAFDIPRYRPRDENVYVGYATGGKQVARFSLHDDRTMVLIVIADRFDPPFESSSCAAQKLFLRAQLANMSWECSEILRGMERCSEIYFDRVSQIRMESWTSDRIALVGDAAYAPSLLAGQGSALAMVGAYVLAGELARARDAREAFAMYETRLGPFMRKKQNAARRFARSFVPSSDLGVLLRAQVTKLFALPGLARVAMRSTLSDPIELPEYGKRYPARAHP